MISRISSIIAAAIALAGCGPGSDRLAGTTNSSETENVLRLVQRSDGTVAARTKVEFFKRRDWDSQVVHGTPGSYRSVTTDSLGYLRLPDDIDSTTTILVRARGEGVFLMFDSKDTAKVWKTAALRSGRGILVSQQTPTGTVCLQGAPFCATIDAKGAVAFDSLPVYQYVPWFRDQARSKVYGLSGSRIEAKARPATDTILFNPDSVRLDDFQDGDGLGLLKGWLGSPYWWIVNQSSSSVPATTTDIPTQILSESNGNRFLQVSFAMQSVASPIPLGLVGLDLGFGTDSSRMFVDLSGLQSLRFRVKGRGSVDVFFKSQTVMDFGDNQNLHRTVALDGNWQDVEVTPDQFLPFDGSIAQRKGVVFAQVAPRVAAVVFQFRSTGTYQLDDVRLVGVKGLQLFGPVR